MKQKNSMKREHSKRVCYAERENVRTKCKLLILLLIATGLAACSNDDEVAPVQERPITVTVSEKPFTAPTSNAAPVRSTRAAITTTETFSAFSIDYVYGTAPSKGQRTATKTAGTCTWTVDGSWPDTDTDNKVKWYAHNDGTFNWDDDEGTPYISFTVDENAAQQKDLLVSTLSASYKECGGHLNFTFDHACAAVKFYVKKANNLSDYTLTVSNVKLSGVVKVGDYYYNTSTWKLGDEKSSYTLYDGTEKTLSNSDYEALGATDAPYLFLIPQKLTAWTPSTALANTYLELTCDLKGGSNVFNGTAYIPFGATLDAGTQYDVKINIGKKTLYNNNGDIIITE